MIWIEKGEPPEVLLTTGVDEAQALCALYEADPAAYDEGVKRLTIKDSVYGHPTVRDALETTHHGKCAFCEVVIPKPYAVSHVEHWRPKGSVKQERGVKGSLPGYYWLAYDWDNLLLACHFCNSTNKGVLFPLEDPGCRACNHHHALTDEAPLLVKPDVDDPADHIEFFEEVVRWRTPRGEATVKALGLDKLEHKPRDDLIAKLRFIHAYIVQNHADPHPEIQAEVARRREFYESAGLASKPFSAMAHAFTTKYPLPAAIAEA